MELAIQNKCKYCGVLSQKEYCCDACELLDQRISKALHLSAENPFSYLDKDDFRETFRQSGEFNYIFFAEGLHCSSCVHLLEKLPEFCDGVREARVNFGQSTVAIHLEEGKSLGQVALAIQELGYKPSLLGPQDDLVEKYKKENRSFLMRIGVAGFCAGNTMLFVVPIYAGLAGEWARAFHWLSFALFLPILFYSAVPFYQGAWNSLKYKVVNVDLPITIAMLSGFFLSTFNLVRGEGAIYFDSTASFLFFILGARYLLKRVQQNYLAPARSSSFFKGEKYLRHTELGDEFIPWNKVKAGDLLTLKRQQNIPADAVLVSSQATLDLSLYNGESLPKDFSSGMILFAGTKVLDESIQVRVQSTFEESKMGQLFKQLDQDAYLKSQFVALTDRLAQKLIITVFAIAIVFFAVYSFINVEEAFHRSLALIVLACPCALAFGSPLTLGLALKKAQSLGILLKNANSLERILKVKNIFFDKTGTLTEGSLSLVHTAPEFISEDLRKVILSLEAHSYHPVAFALRKAWKIDGELFKVLAADEILGKGVHGYIAEDLYEIRHLSETTHDSEIGIEVFKNHHSLCRLYFVDNLRSDSAQLVRTLTERGLQTYLLSGDKCSRVQTIAKACGIQKDHSFGELFPEDKKTLIEQHTSTCMIGDGANDSLALQKADVGIAVKGSVDLSLQSADVYFTRGGLTPLLDFLGVAEQARKVLVRNLTISLVYNSIGGVLALLGFINPMMAAILMPISSIVIIASALWGFR